MLWTAARDFEFAFGDGCGNEERAGLDAGGNDRVLCAAESGDAFDGDG